MRDWAPVAPGPPRLSRRSLTPTRPRSPADGDAPLAVLGGGGAGCVALSDARTAATRRGRASSLRARVRVVRADAPPSSRRSAPADASSDPRRTDPRLRHGDAFPRASASSTSASASLPPPPPTSPAHRRASLARVALGLALLDAYLRAVTLACAAAGVASAPLVVGLVGLTLALLFAPRGVERALTSALEPAVRAVDAKIACVFIPYITAVPASNLPAGAHLCAAAVACAAGYLATMCIAGHVAQAFTVEDDESGGAKDEATGGSSARGAKEESARGPGKAGEAALARAADEKKPPPPPEALSPPPRSSPRRARRSHGSPRDVLSPSHSRRRTSRRRWRRTRVDSGPREAPTRGSLPDHHRRRRDGARLGGRRRRDGCGRDRRDPRVLRRRWARAPYFVPPRCSGWRSA